MVNVYSIQNRLEFTLPHWDNSDIEKGKDRGTSSEIRYFFVAILFMGISLIINLLILYHSFKELFIYEYFYFLYLFVAMLALICCIIPGYFIHKVHIHRKISR